MDKSFLFLLKNFNQKNSSSLYEKHYKNNNNQTSSEEVFESESFEPVYDDFVQVGLHLSVVLLLQVAFTFRVVRHVHQLQ